MKTKEQVLQDIIDNNFKNKGYTVEGVIRFIPRRIDRYESFYGWEDEEFTHRAFLYIMSINGYKQFLEKSSIK